jgi:beta-glucanase (GH16 family)
MIKKLILFSGFTLITCLNLLGQDEPTCQTYLIFPTSYLSLCQSNFVWELVFDDEFNGNSLDPSKWVVYQHVVHHGDNVLYNPDYAITVNNGYLSLISQKETTHQVYTQETDTFTFNNETISYSSAYFGTKYMYSYGKFESSVKIASSNNLFPAFWAQAGSTASGNYNEIDFFEFADHNTTTLKMTDHHQSSGGLKMCPSHYPDPLPNNNIDFSNSFHTYTGIWLKDILKWYTTNNSGIDMDLRHDFPYYSINNDGRCSLDAYAYYYKNNVFPNAPMYIYYDVAFYPTNNFNEPPKTMQVDYVKYYAPAYCSSITITDPSPYVINGTDNFICFKNVTISCTFNVPSNARVDVVGKTGVTLGPGFNVNANFSAKNDPNMGCQ